MGPNNRLLLVVTLSILAQGTFHIVDSAQQFSDNTNIGRNGGKTAAGTVKSNFTSNSSSISNSTNEMMEYEDFDDMEEDRSLNKPMATDNMVKYFSGLISLLTLMYKFNGRVNAFDPKAPTNKNKPQTRHAYMTKRMDKLEETGKKFSDAQDRFDFPQKKFKQTGNDMVDQQYQPLENYPPYNPLTANTAETYGNNDKKTSYDVYDGQKMLADENGQPNSYNFPYQKAKQVKASSYDLAADDGTSWNSQALHPVYQPWSSKDPSPEIDSYHPSNLDSYQSWSQDDDSKGSGKPFEGYPTYHHDLKDIQTAVEHPYEEVEHPVDEDRVSKKPYSYYFLGRKLWYIPLLFSVYFIVYVGALVLKSVARHKIQFPEKVWDLHGDVYGHVKNSRRHRKIDEITENYENAVEKVKNKFM
ncbi:hypothetical protein RUM43_012312 [Polyplax serrata]|uniref:Uncharacterized protein n=1 Tax=Polyplax serrata TaxID=468196 RepID=A0AAN8RZB3_POLSC